MHIYIVLEYQKNNQILWNCIIDVLEKKISFHRQFRDTQIEIFLQKKDSNQYNIPSKYLRFFRISEHCEHS